MAAVDRGIDDDPAAPGRYAISEVDVLDARTAKALVEAADRVERLTPNRAKAGPERLGLAARHLVKVPVRQVPVLRHEAAVAGPLVVRPEHGRHAGIVQEHGPESLQRTGSRDNVGVDE